MRTAIRFAPSSGRRAAFPGRRDPQSKSAVGRPQPAGAHGDNTMYMNFNLLKTDATNQGVGNFNLESRASERHNRSTDLQFREVAILTKSTVHEVRFAYSHDRAQTTPKTTLLRSMYWIRFSAGAARTGAGITIETRNSEPADVLRQEVDAEDRLSEYVPH